MPIECGTELLKFSTNLVYAGAAGLSFVAVHIDGQGVRQGLALLRTPGNPRIGILGPVEIGTSHVQETNSLFYIYYHNARFVTVSHSVKTCFVGLKMITIYLNAGYLQSIGAINS